MRILSIDWDYFMNCTEHVRTVQFPDSGNEDIGSALSTLIWSSCYARSGSNPLDATDIESIKVRSKELDFLKRVIDKNADHFVYGVADSHKHLGEFIIHPDMESKFNSELEIVNIDHHHDLYDVGDTLNCGNWLNKVLEKYPNTSVKWIRNSDSDKCPTNTVACIDDIHDADLHYDIVYLCRSGQWSCPHLDKEFSALNRYIGKRAVAYILREEIPNRWDEDMKKSIAGTKAVLEQCFASLNN